MSKRVVVLALGGNAILPANSEGSMARQIERVDITARQIAELIRQHFKVIITHGNGPQAGSLLIQQEQAEELVPGQPLHICDAMTQGQIGYMLQNRLAYHLREDFNIAAPVCTLITQVCVDADDPAFNNPTKPIGAFHTEEEARFLEETHNYIMRQVDTTRKNGWRRVVISPWPREIVEADSILQLLDNHVIVITCGGGGIPVVREGNDLRGVEAVIDKDRSACLLGRVVDADYLMILTDVEKVYLNWGTPDEKALDTLKMSEAKQYLKQGEFPEGSMGPKVESAVNFVRESGTAAIITSLDRARDALEGNTGTWIIPDEPHTRFSHFPGAPPPGSGKQH